MEILLPRTKIVRVDFVEDSSDGDLPLLETAALDGVIMDELFPEDIDDLEDAIVPPRVPQYLSLVMSMKILTYQNLSRGVLLWTKTR